MPTIYWFVNALDINNANKKKLANLMRFAIFLGGGVIPEIISTVHTLRKILSTRYGLLVCCLPLRTKSDPVYAATGSQFYK